MEASHPPEFALGTIDTSAPAQYDDRRSSGAAEQRGSLIPKIRGGTIYNAELLLLERKHMEAAAAVMADSFKEDGLYVHLLPDPSTRVELLKLFFRNYIELQYDYGGLYATSEKMEAVALIFRSERMGASWASRMSYTWGIARAIAKSLRLCRYISPADFLRGLLGLRSMSSAWLDSLGDQPYLHLDMLVVQQPYRGQGWVRKIMSPLLAECRERGIACTLETQNPRNVGLYEHYGFTVVDTIPLRNSDLKQYCMVCLPGNGGLAERESRASGSHAVMQHNSEGGRMNLTNLRLMNEQVIRIYDTDLPQNKIAKKLIMNPFIRRTSPWKTTSSSLLNGGRIHA